MVSNGRKIYCYKNFDTIRGFKNNFMEDCHSYKYIPIKRIEILRNQNTLKYNTAVDKIINSGFRKIQLRMYPHKV
jgi:hypothetical protein